MEKFSGFPAFPNLSGLVHEDFLAGVAVQIKLDIFRYYYKLNVGARTKGMMRTSIDGHPGLRTFQYRLIAISIVLCGLSNFK